MVQCSVRRERERVGGGGRGVELCGKSRLIKNTKICTISSTLCIVLRNALTILVHIYKAHVPLSLLNLAPGPVPMTATKLVL